MSEEERKDITLTITLPADGSLPTMSGPLANKPICLYMLEIARDMVKAWRMEEKIIKPAGGTDGL